MARKKIWSFRETLLQNEQNLEKIENIGLDLLDRKEELFFDISDYIGNKFSIYNNAFREEWKDASQWTIQFIRKDFETQIILLQNYVKKRIEEFNRVLKENLFYDAKNMGGDIDEYFSTYNDTFFIDYPINWVAMLRKEEANEQFVDFIDYMLDVIRSDVDRYEKYFERKIESCLFLSDSQKQKWKLRKENRRNAAFKNSDGYRFEKEKEKTTEAEVDKNIDRKATKKDSGQALEKKQEKIDKEKTTIEETVEESLLTMSHIIFKNAILKTDNATREKYLKLLEQYICMGGWEEQKYVKAQLDFYRKKLNITESSNIEIGDFVDDYKYFMLFDLLHVLGFNKKLLLSDSMKNVIEKFILDFSVADSEKNIIKLLFHAVNGNYGNWKKLRKHPLLSRNKEYVKLTETNLTFQNTDPFKILVTATMSAGKSTLINALTGKNISLSQNMACTSKLHSILGKVSDDGFSYEYDHDLVLTAGEEELLNDNEKNKTDRIVVSTYYNGFLGGERIVINDSPGVNFSGDAEHKKITENLIINSEYDLLVYLMNATQLCTTDEERHLEYIRRYVQGKPILFVVNKIDNIDAEEENILQIMKNLALYLKEKGFKNPMICPVSARAGYLAKLSQYEAFTRVKQREIYKYIDKFEVMDLKEYYKKYFPGIYVPDSDKDEVQLLKNCGLYFVEKIIKEFCKGGRINGTNLC